MRRENRLPKRKEGSKVFHDLKNEFQTRKAENKTLRDSISQEKTRLREKRESAKKSFFRKIKVVDQLKSQHDAKRDEAAIERYTALKKSEVSSQRKQRAHAFAKKHTRQLILTGIAFFAICAGVITGISVANHNRTVEKYAQAIDLIAKGDYKNAKDLLTDLRYNDSESLLQYVMAENELSAQSENLEHITLVLAGVEEINDPEIRKHWEDATAQAELANKIQAAMDSIEPQSVSLDSKERIESITSDMDRLDDRFRSLLRTDTYDTSKRILAHIENETDVGMIILSIARLPQPVTLTDEVAVKEIRQHYEMLADTDKADVNNLQILLSAEETVQTLVKEREIAAQKEAEAQAKANASAKPSESSGGTVNHPKTDGTTVYVTPYGKCYHRDPDCGGKNSRSITLTDAQRQGLPPCKKCG